MSVRFCTLSGEYVLDIRVTLVALQVHSRLRDLVDSHASVWARVGFKDQWPSPDSIWLFERLVSTSLFLTILVHFLKALT